MNQHTSSIGKSDEVVYQTVYGNDNERIEKQKILLDKFSGQTRYVVPSLIA